MEQSKKDDFSFESKKKAKKSKVFLIYRCTLLSYAWLRGNQIELFLPVMYILLYIKVRKLLDL